MKLYPLKFQPLFKYRIWGGSNLKDVLGKQYNEDSIGESWEVSDVEGDETVVLDGALKGMSLKSLINEFKGDFLGNTVFQSFGDSFPLLIKFIDAKTPLSIQVHPSNEVSKERHNSFGKNEMWYIMDADKDAELIVGFDTEITKNEYKSRLENNTILEVLHHEKVTVGDTFYIPTGRVHAIGSGVLLAEIQQTSDITYRIYDYDRVDATTGAKRELHTELATDVIDYSVSDSYKTIYSSTENVANKLVHSPYFTTNIISLTTTMDVNHVDKDSFVIYMCVEGNANLVIESEAYSLITGEVILVPASIKQFQLKSPKATLIEIYIS